MRAIADLKKAGGDALLCKAVAADQLRVEKRDIADVKPGDRLQISDHNAAWLWARPVSDPSKKGWIPAASIRLE